MPTEMMKRYLENRMDTYRLTRVSAVDQQPWPDQIKEDIGLMMSGSRVDKAVGVFLNAVLTCGYPVIALSRNDLDGLIGSYMTSIGQPSFTLGSGARGNSKTLYAAFWSVLDKKLGAAKVLLMSEPRRPAVVEITSPEYLALLKPVTEELRQRVLKAARPKD
jgi:hypothetical protein